METDCSPHAEFMCHHQGCGYKTAYKHNLLRHIQNKHATNSIRCRQKPCQVVSELKEWQVQAVMSKHGSFQEYICPKCNKSTFHYEEDNLWRNHRQNMIRHLRGKRKSIEISKNDSITEHESICKNINIGKSDDGDTLLGLECDVNILDSYTLNSKSDSNHDDVEEHISSSEFYDTGFEHSKEVIEFKDNGNNVSDLTLQMKNLFQNKSYWGNSHSGSYYEKEHNERGSGLKAPIALLSKKNINCITSNDVYFHSLATQVFQDLPRKKANEVIDLMNANIEAIRSGGQTTIPTEWSRKDIRRRYIEGKNSMMKNAPVPRAIKKHGFSYIPLKQALRHVIAKDTPLKTLYFQNRNNWEEDWKNSKSGLFHSNFLQNIYNDLCGRKDLPPDLRIHFLHLWSDGFNKNIFAKHSKSSLQAFTATFIPKKEYRDLKHDTIPIAVGFKQSDHHEIMTDVLLQARELQTVVQRIYCGHEKKIVSVLCFCQVIQNDLIERACNTYTLQNGLYSKRFGWSCVFHDNVPSCYSCFRNRLERRKKYSYDDYPKDRLSHPCDCCADWWQHGSENKLGWFPKPEHYPSYTFLHKNSNQKTDSVE